MTVSELSDYITRRKKPKKSQYLNEVQNGCTRSRIRIDLNENKDAPQKGFQPIVKYRQ